MHALRFVHPRDGEEYIRAKLRLNIRQDLLEKPNHRIGIRARFFVDRADEEKSVSLIKPARSGRGRERVADNANISNTVLPKLFAILV